MAELMASEGRDEAGLLPRAKPFPGAALIMDKAEYDRLHPPMWKRVWNRLFRRGGA